MTDRSAGIVHAQQRGGWLESGTMEMRRTAWSVDPLDAGVSYARGCWDFELGYTVLPNVVRPQVPMRSVRGVWGRHPVKLVTSQASSFRAHAMQPHAIGNWRSDAPRCSATLGFPVSRFPFTRCGAWITDGFLISPSSSIRTTQRTYSQRPTTNSTQRCAQRRNDGEAGTTLAWFSQSKSKMRMNQQRSNFGRWRPSVVGVAWRD